LLTAASFNPLCILSEAISGQNAAGEKVGKLQRGFDILTLAAGPLVKLGSRAVSAISRATSVPAPLMQFFRGARTASGPAVVVGETMDRVMDAAQFLGAEWYRGGVLGVPLPEWFYRTRLGSALGRADNWLWITRMKAQGRVIYDIGLDAARTTRGLGYAMERRLLRHYRCIGVPWPAKGEVWHGP
jgi:hypothetical protein